MKTNTIQHKKLCKIGQLLAYWGIPTLMKHIEECKKCKKQLKTK